MANQKNTHGVWSWPPFCVCGAPHLKVPTGYDELLRHSDMAVVIVLFTFGVSNLRLLGESGDAEHWQNTTWDAMVLMGRYKTSRVSRRGQSRVDTSRYE